ncbi:hypothetical protein ES705_38132 [subsurface metagenome]
MHKESKAEISLLYNLPCGEMLLGKDAIEKATSVCEWISPFKIYSRDFGSVVSLNMPFLKDVLARALHKRGGSKGMEFKPYYNAHAKIQAFAFWNERDEGSNW